MPDRSLDRLAAAILRANDRGTYTVPAADLYPFQWNWDSAITALGWLHLDERRAFLELRTLLAARWPCGMVPQIVFHRPDPRYFPGPEVWATGRTPPTSGITQPPVAASCLRVLVEGARDRELAAQAARELLPALEHWHRWFSEVRGDPATGLVVTVHPWETGMDNSPAFDEPLRRVPVPAAVRVERRDLAVVPADQRPRPEDYRRYLALVWHFRALGYDQRRMARESPLRLADPATHALLIRAERDLAALAERLDLPGAQAALRRAEALAQAARRHLADPATGLWHAFDLINGRRVPVATAAGFLALGTVEDDGRLARTLDRWLEATPFPLATVHPADPHFERRRYWRGPAWPVLDFLIARGADDRAAARLREAVRELVRRSGFREYFDPLDGRGLGGRDFSWTAALWLHWARTPP